MADPYAIVLRDGKKVDALTDGALKRAEADLGYPLTITQGSYNEGGVAASAGTHDGGGVVDLMPWDRDRKVKALRAVGFAAWFRPAIPGLWPAHIHAVLIGHAKLAPVAFRQVQAYLARRDGLKGNGPDVDPGWTNVARYTVEAFKADVLREELKARIARKRTKRQALRDQIDRLRNRLRGLPR
jgi:hypothetical protein